MDKQSTDASNQSLQTNVPIVYVEFAANDLNAIKAFYSSAFNWQFIDYGPEYVAFENAGMSGGFYLVDKNASKQADADQGSPLVVLHSSDLEACLQHVVACGGSIKTEIFSFPGGRRFHFLDPCNNELSVCCYT
jgi:predicted enzyme related to lactoylglutathione lyase